MGFHPSTDGYSGGYTGHLLPEKLKESLYLSTEDCTACKNVWQNLQRLSNFNDQGKLDVGIRKFNDIYDRKLLEDKIIDMSILLESTLLYGIRDELRFRLRLRGANLLKSDRDPMKTYNLLKEFYDLRCVIVHEGGRLSSSISVNNRQFSPDKFVTEMESVCREVLGAFIEKVAGRVSIDAVVKYLDDEAIHR